jgi:hypothetical protein
MISGDKQVGGVCISSSAGLRRTGFMARHAGAKAIGFRLSLRSI